jgi:restriction system protein
MLLAVLAHSPFLKLAAAVVCLLAFVPTSLSAFVIQLGDSRQTVIETYGYPKSLAQLDTREIFNYPEGSVVLDQGRVAEIRFTKGEPKSLRRAPAPQPVPVVKPVVVPQKPKAQSIPSLVPSSVVPPQPVPQQPPPSLLRAMRPLLWIPLIAIVVGITGRILKSRLRRLEPDFTGVYPDRRSAPQKTNPVSLVPQPPITRLTREALDRLEWRRFEELTQGYFEKTGWSARRSSVGADGGIDIFLEKNGPEKRIACVQCKQRSNEIIGVKYIREFFGVMVSEGIAEGYFVTTNTFSDEAVRFAQGKPLHLISGDELLGNFASLAADQHESAVRHAFRDDFETPTCPSCDVKMVARRGGAADFWGCRNFPRCKRTFKTRT